VRKSNNSELEGGSALKWYLFVLGIVAVSVVALFTISPWGVEPVAGDYFYAITNAGVLCGYSVIDTSLAVIDGKQVIVLEQTMFSMGKLLGMDVDSNVKLVYHIDPKTGQFIYHDYDVDQGQSQFAAETRIEEDGAHCTTSFGREDHVVKLPPGTLLENTLFFKNILEDFADTDMEDKVYEIFDVADQEVQEVRYSRAGEETLELAGKEYSAVMVDKRNLVTGVLIRMWLDSETGMCVKVVVNDIRVIYLADSSLARKLERFEADDYIFTKTNMSIADVLGVSYMKVRAKIRPTGMIVTQDNLNVPGQSFTGTVEENLIEGVFEIEHPRYDGIDAPPFPPPRGFSDDTELAQYINPSQFIESDDPGIVEKARELTEGSADSWEATRRLSEWVSTEIAYSIPGGGSARGVFEAKAGECGGHSVLLAAFCRSVGIPARVVWGITYVPSQGGMFGQHGWNELYMGAAGWVPVDATGPEIDFVDSGHIRLGIFESFAAQANSKEFEILDYRVAGVTAETAEAAAAKYEAYVGEYGHPGMPKACAVLVQDGSLVFEIPDKVALAFEDPDERGRWQCKLAKHVYLTFETNDVGDVDEAHLHELYKLPKQSGLDDDDIDEDVPEDFKPYLGNYLFAAVNAEFTISYKRGGLRMYHPLEKKTSSLSPPNEDGGWVADNDRHTVYFERSEDGSVSSLTIDGTSKFKR
jgi:hypothetical protein